MAHIHQVLKIGNLLFDTTFVFKYLGPFHSLSNIQYTQYIIYDSLNYFSLIKMSRINGCRLENFGSMPFELEAGACSTIGDEYVLLCFPNWNAKKCNK